MGKILLSVEGTESCRKEEGWLSVDWVAGEKEKVLVEINMSRKAMALVVEVLGVEAKVVEVEETK